MGLTSVNGGLVTRRVASFTAPLTHTPPLPSPVPSYASLPAAQRALRSGRDNKLDSLLVLRFIIVAVVVADFDCSVVRPPREAHNFRASVYLGSAFNAVQCYASKRRETAFGSDSRQT